MMPGHAAAQQSTPLPPLQPGTETSAAPPSSVPAGFTVTAPELTLPKGGGAIRGIGEKFDTNPLTGTGTASIPIATSPGRSGFGPALALSYDSGAGNSVHGFGWSLNTPHICRKTDKGLPLYHDDVESDTYILSGAEDLVRFLKADQTPQVDTASVPGYAIHRYRPRIDTAFARIERWTRSSDADTHWRSYSRDNILTIYGKDDNSRICDPDAPSHIFSWLICETRDDRGNAVVYDYKPDDAHGVDTAAAHQQTRNMKSRARSTNRYLKRIRYGNRATLLNDDGGRPINLTDDQINTAGWMFELVVDYGEHDQNLPAETRKWDYRRGDAFSTRRPGFEVRTTRLAKRFLMFHHIPATPAGEGYDGLVRSTDLIHTAAPTGYAYLTAAIQRGYKLNSDGSYVVRDMPPVDFSYTEAAIGTKVHNLDPESLKNLPSGIDGANYQFIDLHGEGVAGVLTRTAEAWYYKPNLSPLQHDSVAVFGPSRRLETIPNATTSARFADLAGDGRLDLIDPDAAVSGFYRHDKAQGWEPLRRFQTYPHSNLDDPNVRMLDLVGDGLADLMITQDDAIVWHRSLGEAGFGPANRIGNKIDENVGPRVVFANNDETIHLADMTGDGLTDLVRIRSRGEVCYWPNLGFGRFGPKIIMDNSPHLDEADQYDSRRLILADIDGSGTVDLIYLHREGVRLYFNESGNQLSDPTALNVFPAVSSATTVAAHDLHGNGTACLVWSSPLAADSGHQLRYIDLMASPDAKRNGSIKPHLLSCIDNNLGAQTTITYAPSTKFYLQDQRGGRPWITSLPFPVHVVERVETYDAISRNQYIATYLYHDGYFDHTEREFRGFGMVEQFDTEQITTLTGPKTAGANQDPAHSVPPVHTKTWFHTGVYLGRDHISDYYAGLLKDSETGEYYREPGLDDKQAAALLLPDTLLPPGLTLDEEREACRALKGSMLRQEIYADDAQPTVNPLQVLRAATPYTVMEQNFDIRVLQRTGPNRHAAFLTHPRETLTYYYERLTPHQTPSGSTEYVIDPRSKHTLTLDVDAYGDTLKQVTIGYGRRTHVSVIDDTGRLSTARPNPGLADVPTDTDRDKQTAIQLTYAANAFTNPIDGINHDGTAEYNNYRTPLPAETQTYELTGFTPSGGRFTKTDFVTENEDGTVTFVDTEECEYEDTPQPGKQRRLIEHVRTLYRPNDLGTTKGAALALLPLRVLESCAELGVNYRLAFTPGLLTEAYRRGEESLIPDPTTILAGKGPDSGGYHSSTTLKADGVFPQSDRDGYWWIPSGRHFLSPIRDDASPAHELAYARLHFRLPQRFRTPFDTSAVPTETTVTYDDYDLLIRHTTDPLGNQITAGERQPDGSIDTTRPGLDYRVLQAFVVSDPNRNRTQVVFDALGMVNGTAVMGKPGQGQGDSLSAFNPDLPQAQLIAVFDTPDPMPALPGLLKSATSRTIYDLDRFHRTRQTNPTDPSRWQPVGVARIARETHAADPLPPQGLRIQMTMSYSDGFARQIQTKVPAGPLPRSENEAANAVWWVASGWTIFNNKGDAVRQYEPFFTPTAGFEFGAAVGVSPIVFYDPLRRSIATLNPNNTYGKVVVDPWAQTSYDANDTSAPRGKQTGDPRSDPHIGGYVREYFARQPADWQTWYAERSGGALGPDEQVAAVRAAAHSDTPSTLYLDALGRAFLTATRNRVVCADHPQNGVESAQFSRVELDIEGNQRVIRDADRQSGDLLGRIVMTRDYNLIGQCLHQASMEAGASWVLSDIQGNTIRTWDSRGHNKTSSYDALRRLSSRTVRGTTDKSDPRTIPKDITIDKVEYGENRPNADSLNIRGRIFQHFDSAGVIVNARLADNGDPIEAFDFKGNLLHSTRRLVTDYAAIPDWSVDTSLDIEFFESSTRYDALNRVIQSVAPHSNSPRAQRNVAQPIYNQRGLLEQIDVWLSRPTEPNKLINADVEEPSVVGITSIGYDAKGQRLRIDYKNGASTRYRYDSNTFRLVQIYTLRGAAFTHDCDNPSPPPPTIASPEVPPPGASCGLQNLSYTYDAAGNVTHIRDGAQQTIYFRNKRVEPSNDYVYDARYRLIQAVGREHLGQNNRQNPPDPFDTGKARLDQPGDGAAMGAYAEMYVYDDTGNLTTIKHTGTDPALPGWTRSYAYSEPSLIEDGTGGSRLKTSNRLSKTISGSDGAAVTPYTYDVHGNTTYMAHLGNGAGGSNMDWDHRDRLHRIDRGGGGQAHFVYDSAGRRVRKIWQKSPGLTEERVYLGGYEIFRTYPGSIADTPAAFERETLHVMDNQRRVALVENRIFDASGNDPAPQCLIRYQHDNHLNSTALELDEQAQVISYEEYAPFGYTTYQAVRSQTETPKRYRFTGKERDEETGLNYHGTRYYAPWLGRWTSPDTAGLIDGPNLYEYARSNPCVLVDPSGTQSTKAPQDMTLDEYLAVNDRRANPLPRAAVERQYRLDHLPRRAHQGSNSGGSPNVGAGGGQGGSESGSDPITQAGSPNGTASTGQEGLSTGDPEGRTLNGTGERKLGAARSEGQGGTGGTADHPMTELDAFVLLSTQVAPPPPLPEGSGPSTSGGIPEGRGTHASRVGQVIYAAVNTFFTFFSGVVERGLGKAWGAVKPAFVRLSSGAATLGRELYYGSAFLFLGAGGGAGSRRAGRLLAARATSRRVAIGDALRSLRAGSPTPQALYLVERLEATHGREAVDRFIETAKLPPGYENSHLFPASEWPEYAHRGDLTVVTDSADHRIGHHGGDTTKPLHGFPIDPEWEQEWGFQIIDPDPE